MPNTTAYDIRLRGDDGTIINRTIQARIGVQAQGEAMDLAAKLTAQRGVRYRVARVDQA